ncbi:hypothetical protein LTS12_021175, partial [Elasticomyces elasticus]
MGRTQLFLHPLHIQLANGSQPQQREYSSAVPPLRLTPRDDSTRVQLQRQRLKDQNMSRDNTEWPTDSTTAFFASLRTNLRLHASPPPSPMSTPQSMSNSAASLPPPSPLSQPVDSPMDATFGAAQDDTLAGVPELTSYATDDADERFAALKLVADSIAQMRQSANNSLIWHPLNSAVAIAILALVARYTYEARQDKVIA